MVQLKIASVSWVMLLLPFTFAQHVKHHHGAVHDITKLNIDKDLFENNLIDFTWNDPELRRMLHGGSQPPVSYDFDKQTPVELKRRAWNFNPFKRWFGPAIKLPSCIGCQGIAAGWALTYWSTDKFLQTIRTTPEATRNKCVFYGRRERDGMFPSGLSDIANQFACNTNKITIWYLWPRGQTNVFPGSNPTNDEGALDFYAMFQKGSHLQPIHDAGYDARTIYFENMSRAVALTCLGDIYVMADRADNFASGKSSGGIWWEVELPTLQSRLGSLGKLTAISTRDFTKAYNVNWNTAETTGPGVISREVSEMLKQLQEAMKNGTYIGKRDQCSIAGAYEPAGVDFFG